VALSASQWHCPGLTGRDNFAFQRCPICLSALPNLPFGAAPSAFQRCPICLSALYNKPSCRSFELAWAWRKQTASDTVHAVTALLEVTTAKQAAAHDDTKDRFW